MEGELELLRVGIVGLRRKWRPQHAVLKGSTLHLSQVTGAPEHLKTLPMAGVAISRKDISRPADAWRNLIALILPPLADRSRGVKKYTLSAATAELQAAWMSALTTASQSPAERQIAAYSKGHRLSRSLSRLAAAAFRPLQLGMSALSPSECNASQEPSAEAEQAPGTDSVQCWALPTATSTQQFALPPMEQCDGVEKSGADGPAVQAAPKHPDQLLLPDAAAAPQDAQSTGAPGDTCSRSVTGRSDNAAAAAAAAAATDKVTYPQLQAQAAQNGSDNMSHKAHPAAEQPNVTRLIEQQVQRWDGADDSLPTLQPALKA